VLLPDAIRKAEAKPAACLYFGSLVIRELSGEPFTPFSECPVFHSLRETLLQRKRSRRPHINDFS
jgi:hypothetical protein